MGISRFIVLSLLSLLVFSISLVTSATIEEKFLQCLSLQQTSVPIPVYSQNNASYTTILLSSARNSRFLLPTTPKPQFIIVPTEESHFQAAVICCRQNGLEFKARSGGHDVEGLSYVSDFPFVIIEMVNYRAITVDVPSSSAWVQAGANLGEVYYRIGEKSKNLGFPAGLCPTVGVGGHLGGGGIGTLVRKYGLAADNILDARIVNADGQILDRQSMGRDLFWAIRGGGASSFAVVLSWKIRLVPVPTVVTVSTVSKTLQQGATDLVYRWQFIADQLPDDLYIGLTLTVANASSTGGRTVVASFSFLYLGGADDLVQLTQRRFPQLGFQHSDCIEMSWVETHVYFYAPPGSPLEILLDRDPTTKSFLKVKTDYIKSPIPRSAFEGIWNRFMEEEVPIMEEEFPIMVWTPLGARMNQIPEFDIPYPHRAGNIYNILYGVSWQSATESAARIDWMRRFYDYMTPYASKFPRTAYINYKDLDLGEHRNGVYSSAVARTWNNKYFKWNYERLVYVKSKVDPTNFFRNKQSIPPS